MVGSMRMTLWRCDVRLEHPLAASQQLHDERSRLYLELEHDGVVGWGEIDPQPEALHGDAGLSDVIDELRVITMPQVLGAVHREGDVPSWTRIARFAGPRAASSAAVALVEMSMLDRELRLEHRNLVSQWPRHFDTPLLSGVSVVSGGPVDVAPGSTRVRVKISSQPLERETLRALEAITVPVLLDYNCGAGEDHVVLSHIGQLRDVVELVAIEQPFAPGNLVDHARLAEQCDVALSLDEGVRTIRDLDQITRYGAAQMVCIKPARVGGYANARTMIERAKAQGLRPYLGGFFESPLARGVNRCLAEHCVEEPSDLGEVASHSRDVAKDFVVLEGGFGLAPSKELLGNARILFTLD